MATRKVCPACESHDLVRRKNTGITPHQGYVCQECGVLMRPEGYGIVYAVAMVIGLAFGALGVAAVVGMGEFGHGVYFAVAGFGVAGFTFRELLGPSPRWIEIADEEE
jgi:hypothetical protein